MDGPLTFETILHNAGGNLVNHHVYLCCPLPMKMSFEKNFREARVLAENIHFEEFNFR
jgi:predicted ferric reductase